jgi:hypothetical protein
MGWSPSINAGVYLFGMCPIPDILHILTYFLVTARYGYSRCNERLGVRVPFLGGIKNSKTPVYLSAILSCECIFQVCQIVQG